MFTQEGLEQLPTSRRWKATMWFWWYHGVGMLNTVYPNNSKFEPGQWQTFFSNAVMCLGVVTIPNQWFNVSFQLDHQLRIIKINLQVVVWPLLALFSSHYFSFVSHQLDFWFMLGDTVLALVWTVFPIQMHDVINIRICTYKTWNNFIFKYYWFWVMTS